MGLREVIYLPDPRLREETQVVTHFDANLQALVNDMIETMYHEQGIGLAAPQIGLPLKLAVIDVSETRNEAFCIINPEILDQSGEVFLQEGCLSVPNAYDKAPRAIKVRVRAQDREGKSFEIEAEGLLAHCLQHEIDHLNGKLFLDYLSPLKKQLAMNKMDKFKRRLKTFQKNKR